MEHSRKESKWLAVPIIRVWWRKRREQALRHRQNGRGEDDGNDTAHIKLQRHRRLLAAHKLPAHVSLSVAHWNLAPCCFDKNDESDYRYQRQNHRDHSQSREHVTLGN